MGSSLNTLLQLIADVTVSNLYSQTLFHPCTSSGILMISGFGFVCWWGFLLLLLLFWGGGYHSSCLVTWMACCRVRLSVTLWFYTKFWILLYSREKDVSGSILKAATFCKLSNRDCSKSGEKKDTIKMWRPQDSGSFGQLIKIYVRVRMLKEVGSLLLQPWFFCSWH